MLRMFTHVTFTILEKSTFNLLSLVKAELLRTQSARQRSTIGK